MHGGSKPVRFPPFSLLDGSCFFSLLFAVSLPKLWHSLFSQKIPYFAFSTKNVKLRFFGGSLLIRKKRLASDTDTAVIGSNLNSLHAFQHREQTFRFLELLLPTSVTNYMLEHRLAFAIKMTLEWLRLLYGQ